MTGVAVKVVRTRAACDRSRYLNKVDITAPNTVVNRISIVPGERPGITLDTVGGVPSFSLPRLRHSDGWFRTSLKIGRTFFCCSLLQSKAANHALPENIAKRKKKSFEDSRMPRNKKATRPSDFHRLKV